MKVVQGTFREDRHAGEVVVVGTWPQAPAHLNSRERDLWDGLQQKMSTWTAESDWIAINGVVSLMDRLLTIQEHQRRTDGSGNPITFKYTPAADGEVNAEPKENPLYGMELKFWTALRGYIAVTGLSPTDRAKVQAPPADTAPVNPLDRFLKRGGHGRGA